MTQTKTIVFKVLYGDPEESPWDKGPDTAPGEYEPHEEAFMGRLKRRLMSLPEDDPEREKVFREMAFIHTFKVKLPGCRILTLAEEHEHGFLDETPEPAKRKRRGEELNEGQGVLVESELPELNRAREAQARAKAGRGRVERDNDASGPPSQKNANAHQGKAGESRGVPDEGARLRDEGMARAERAADPAWKAAANRALDALIDGGQEFTSDDVWAIVGYAPAEPRALGPLITARSRRGQIRNTGKRKLSERPEHHKYPCTVWVAA